MTAPQAPVERMELASSLVALRDVRRDDEIIITTMGSAREWMRFGELHPLDVVLVPSSMGHGTSIALGLALARPELRVIVCMGDGSMLMNLGSLASIVASGARNLAVLLFDNGVYEVTGHQPTAGAAAARAGGRPVDFVGVARASGFDSVHRYGSIRSWTSDARQLLDAAGPTFIALDVEPVAGGEAPHSPGPASDRARRLMHTLSARP